MSTTLVSLFHHRWAVPLLAELHRTRGSRFVALANRLPLSRESLRRTLAHLIDDGLVARNPGYGHPLRPEYVLTPKGERVAPACASLVRAIASAGVEEAALRKWSLPVLHALGRGGPRRFSRLRDELPGISSRALALALKELEGASLVRREVVETYPPSAAYAVAPAGRPLLPPLAELDAIPLSRSPRESG